VVPSKPLATEFVATLPMMKDTTLNGAASSSLSLGKDERSRRLGVVAAAVTVAVVAFMLVWFLARGRHGEDFDVVVTEPKGPPESSATSPPPRPATGAEASPSPAAVPSGHAQGSAEVTSGRGGGPVAPSDPGPQRPAPPANQREPESPTSPEVSPVPAPAEPPPGPSALAAQTPGEAGGRTDVAGRDAPRSETAKGLPGRTSSSRSRAGAAHHVPTGPVEGAASPAARSPGTDTSPGKGPAPGEAVAPGPGSAAVAVPLDAECSSAAFAGVFGSKAPSKKAVLDARSRLAQCKPSMDPGLYADIYRRLIELY
jgi:hypothetical protein